jgi:hypothetical protein
MTSLPLSKIATGNLYTTEDRVSILITDASVEAAASAGWTKEEWKTARPVLLHTIDGKTVALFHGCIGMKIPAFAWGADLIVCCHPEHLPVSLRRKHVFPDWQGVTLTLFQGNKVEFSIRRDYYVSNREVMKTRVRHYAPLAAFCAALVCAVGVFTPIVIGEIQMNQQNHTEVVK